MNGILLDTHTWIWLMKGEELGNKTQQIVNNAVKNEGIYIAAISTWEIAMLVSKGKIILETPVLMWIEDALSLPGIQLKPLTPEIAVESTQLPGNFHGDPADRLIVATARINQLTLLTRDQKIIDYATNEFLSVTPI